MTNVFKRSSKAFAVFSAGAVASSLFAFPALAAPSDEAANNTTDLVLYNINDFHGRLDSTAVAMACTLETDRANHPNNMLLSAGDNIGASEFSSFIDKDEPTLRYLDSLDLKVSVLGNHEFDTGLKDLQDRIIPHAKFAQVAANVYKDGKRVFPAYKVVQAGDLKIAVVGGVTQETPQLVSPGGIKGLEFRNAVDEVNKAIKELRASGEKYDLLVAEYHDGNATGAKAKGERPEVETGLFKRMVDETDPEVAVVFNGHTHVSYAFEAKVPGTDRTRPIVQDAAYGTLVGKLDLSVDKQTKKVTVDSIDQLKVPRKYDGACDDKDLPRFKAAQQIVKDAIAKGNELGSEVVGEQTADITTAYGPRDGAYENGKRVSTNPEKTKGDDRARVSSLSNQIADSMVWATNQDSYAGKRATIGVMNPGGVRADLFYKAAGAEGDGKITYKEASNVLPFANNLNTVDLTGAQFKQLLEQQWQQNEDGTAGKFSRPYLALGLSENVFYTFNPDAPLGQHVTNVYVDGKPVQDDATYTVVAANFLINGGDNFWAFKQGTNVTDTGMVDRDAWATYLKATKPMSPDFQPRSLGVVQKNDRELVVSGVENYALAAPEVTELKYRLLVGDEAVAEGTGTYKMETAEGYPNGVVTLAHADKCFAGSVKLEVEVAGLAKPIQVPGTFEVKADPSCQKAPAPGDEEKPVPGKPAPEKPGKPAPEQPAKPAPAKPAPAKPAPGKDSRSLLPRTGAEVAPYGVAALGLTLLGGAAVAIRRKANKN